MTAKALGVAPTFSLKPGTKMISTRCRFMNGCVNERNPPNYRKGVLGAHVYKTVYGSVLELHTH